MRRWWLRSFFAVATLAGLLVLAVAWLIATPGGARLILDRTASFLGKGAQVGGVEGSLAGTLRIKAIDITRPDLVVHVRDVEIERASGGPWFGRVVFSRVEAGSVEVRTASSGAAARVPLAFEAPYPLRVEALHVGELRVGAIAKEGVTPPPDLVIRNLVAVGEGDQRSWQLDKGSAQTPWGQVNLQGKIATAAPFSLDLRGDLSGERQDARYRIAAQVAGTLRRMEAKFDAEERDLRGTGTAVIEPFEKQPIRALAMHARDIDIGRYASVPHTRLAGEVSLEPTAHGFAGPVHIVNAEPGAIDLNRVPVVSADGRIAWSRENGVDQLEMNETRFALSGGGTAVGGGRWRAGRLEAQWRIANVDPAQLDTRLRPARLNGTVAAVSEAGGQRFAVSLADPRFTLDGAATLKASRLDIEHARVKQGNGVVEGKGYVVLAARRDFRFEGRAQHFDPSAFAKAPAGDLNFDFVASGVLEPALSGEARLEIAQSRLADLPVSGSIRVAGDARRIASADARLALGETKVQARGSFGRAGDAMDIAIQSPNLAAAAKPLGLALAGSVDARGTLTGTFAAPGGRFDVKASALSMPGGFYAANLDARGDIATDAGGKVDANIEARGLTQRSGDSVRALAEHATLTLQGTRAAHRASLVATLTKDAELRAVLQGGLEPRAPKLSWRGEVASLSLTGTSAFALANPAPLAAALDRVELGDAVLKASWGEAHLVSTRWTPALLELRGSTPGINLRNAARALRLEAVPRGNLAVAAEWDVRAAEHVDGVVSMSRTSGDLRVGDPPQPLGLEELKLRVEARRGQAKASVSVRGQRVGRLDGELNATLQRVSAGLGIVEGAPISGRVDARMDSLAWAAAWMGPEARAEGTAEAHVDISGTAKDPRWRGRVDATNVSLREPQTGFEVEKGTAALRLDDRSLVVEKLAAATPWHPSDQASRSMQGFEKPASGTLSAEGSIDLASRTGAIVIKASSVPITQLSTRFLALSGEAKLEARSDGLLATGALRADAGWIGALATPLPSVSDDVVVVRRTAASDERRTRERIRMDVRFNLGEHVRYTGRGLDTRLAGELRVVGEVGGSLRGTGAIRTVAGSYDAYGQKLSIEHGTLTFFGSIENPSLDVLALRKGLPVEAGVEVLGNVARPRVRLVSLPEVPDPEKISWLVLGRGPGDVSQGEAATLVSAATAILGRGTGTDKIVQRFGFDEVRVGRSDTASALGTLPQSTVAGRTGNASAAEVVTVGKRLSKDFYLVYERGLADAEGALRLTWQITRSFQMLVRAGYLPGVDAVYRWTFE